MRRNALLLAMAISCVLAAGLTVLIARYTTFNLFTLRIWFVIPVGAFLIGMAAGSGALLAAWFLHVRPSRLQGFISAVVVGVATMALIYYLDYRTLIIDGKQVSDFIDFADYLDIAITKTHTLFGRGQKDIGEVGGLGYGIALLELLGFMGGVLSPFGFIDSLPSCTKCSAYLRRRRSSTTKALTVEEANTLYDKFTHGDLATVRLVMAWEPQNRSLATDQPKARLLFKLLQCPRCSGQTVTADVQVANKRKNWRETKGMKVSRQLEEGATL